MNDSSWIHSAVAKAKFFLIDLTRQPMPDVVAIIEEDKQFVKGVIIESLRSHDVGAMWWTIRDDVQVGLECGYFDVAKERPVISPVLPKAKLTAKKQAQSASAFRGQGHGRSR